MQDKVDSPLIETAGECSMCLFNMIVFGIATPYLHNGTLNVEDENGEVWSGFLLNLIFEVCQFPEYKDFYVFSS